MRIHATYKPRPRVGDRRTVRRFVLWRRIGEEIRCLEWTWIVQEFKHIQVPNKFGFERWANRWIDVRWK